MTSLPDTTQFDTLRSLGIEDGAQAQRLLDQLAGQGITDDDVAAFLPLLFGALQGSPDPDRALKSFERWFAAVGSRYTHFQMLRNHPVALDLFCYVTGSSQYFADLLARQPEYFEILANPGVRGGTKTAATFYRDVSGFADACQRPELKRDALRRWKAREMLRIGIRDLVGLADMPATAREFSNLADACVQKAYDIALATFGPDTVPAFAIIGMGKLGGQELNYSSDIDLMFVHGNALPERVALADGRGIAGDLFVMRLAESIVKILNEDTASGHVFRVNMRLRPEGRFGPLTRSLASYEAYYESWAENWERQALLKARFVGGDSELGHTYMRRIVPFVYTRRVSAAVVEDIRANKRRIEQKCALEGQTWTNVKTGFGGIRDIEFLVQRLQLEFAGALPKLRTPNTLSALQRLRHAGFLTQAEAHDLAQDYQFLRNLEHRLQLLNGFQTQNMPPIDDARERTRLARRMGFVDRAAFEQELETRRQRVHATLERLFYGEEGDGHLEVRVDGTALWAELPELLDNIDAPTARERIALRLIAAGFHDLPSAFIALELPMRGNEFGQMPPDTPVEFKAISARLLELLERSPDPDAGLAGIEAIALALPNRAHWYAALDDSPDVLERFVSMAAGAPYLLKQLARHLEWIETLVGQEQESDLPEAQELLERVQGAKGDEAKLDAVARFYQREILRIGAREIQAEEDVTATLERLTRLAEILLQTVLDLCIAPLVASYPDPEFARAALDRVAIFALGKLGGAEASFGSDWDLVFGYDQVRPGAGAESAQERFALAETLVQRFLAATNALATRGAAVEVDLRLRPWGKKGALIHSPRALVDYYRGPGETWERQAALKARFVAGNPSVGRRLERLLRAVSFGRGVTPDEDFAVQTMKRRIERERLKPEFRITDLKLGHGGLSDIEWLVQRLQLLVGSRFPTVCVPNTLQALDALVSTGQLHNSEAEALASTYRLLTRLRNALYLRTGKSHDVVPDDPIVRRALARILGETDTERFWLEVAEARAEVRSIFERRFFSNTIEWKV